MALLFYYTICIPITVNLLPYSIFPTIYTVFQKELYNFERVYRFIQSTYTMWSRVSSGSIVSDYGLDDRAIGVRSPAGVKEFSCILCVQTGSGANQASCPMGTGGPFPGGKSAAGA
jgi:hypothetical protein